MQKEKLKQNANPVGATSSRPHFVGKTQKENQKGITLIALIITIIVMLILVRVSVTVALNGGLFTSAKDAVDQTQIASEREQLLSAAIGEIGDNGKVDLEELDKNLPNGFKKVAETETTRTYKSSKGNKYQVDENGNITFLGKEVAGGSGGGTEPTYKENIEGLATGVSLIAYEDLATDATPEIKGLVDAGKISAVLTETIEGTETLAVVPTGYEVSEVDGEDSISGGLVIKDGSNNEFVWIPVPNVVIDISDDITSIDGITANYGASPNWNTVKTALTSKIDLTSGTYPMAAKFGTEDNYHYIGISYLFDTNGNISSLGILNGGTLYVEPRAVTGQYAYKTGTSYDAVYSNIITALTSEELENITVNEESTTEECAVYFNGILQNDFDKMVQSVEKVKGFYVGRYETGGFNETKVVSKADRGMGAAGDINNVTWYHMYKMQKEFGNSTIGSTMIWGSQYDQVMNFVNGKPDGEGTAYNVGAVDTENPRNAGQTSATGTGNTPVDQVANIYDLEGNMWEWTAEASKGGSRADRGR